MANILSFMPTWVFWILLAIPICMTIPYWGPIWSALPKPLKLMILAAGGLFTAWHAGRYQQRKADAERQRQQDAKAIQNRMEVDRDVQNLSGDDIDAQLSRNKWMRKD